MDYDVQTISWAKLGKMVGNAMSVNVLERLMFRMMQFAGLLASTGAAPQDDRWHEGSAVKHLCQELGPRTKSPSQRGAAKGGKPTVVEPKATLNDVAAPFKRAKRRDFIVDSGASRHIVDFASLTHVERKTLR